MKVKFTQELINLCWELLELKFAYYRPDKLNSKYKHLAQTPDSTYDAKEDRYRQLCLEQGLSPTACDMVGFDESRPSCRLVKNKLSS